MGKQVKGRNKSNRPWKREGEKATASIRRGTPSLSKSFKKKQKEREAREALKALQTRLRQEKAELREQKKQRRIEQEKRRLRNELKATTYQKLGRPDKLKTMNKKQLRKIKKTIVNQLGEVELVSPWQK